MAFISTISCIFVVCVVLCFLRASCDSFCYSWPFLGCSWGAFGPLLGAVGPLLGALGRSWAALGLSWLLLGRSWALFGRSWALLGRSWDALGRSWGALGALLGRSWDALGVLLAALHFQASGSRGRIRRIQAPEAQNARDCSHRLFPRGGRKHFGSDAAPLTATRANKI